MSIASVVSEFVSHLNVGDPVVVDDIVRILKNDGYSSYSRSQVTRELNKLGYRSNGAGVKSVWYRDAASIIEEEKKMETTTTTSTVWPSLQERLEAQVAAGERKPCVRRVNEMTPPCNEDPEYIFESSITTKKLKGKYGNYTVMSDGQVIVELLVDGTIVNDEFKNLVRELCAVRKEMEAMANGG